MANRDDYRGYGGDGGRDRWRQDDRQAGRQGGREQRSFGGEGRYNSDQARWGQGSRGGSGQGENEPWRRDRYGSRYDQDRTNYGSGWDHERADYGRGQREDTARYGGGRGYGGQEYGMEGRGGGQQGGGGAGREGWRGQSGGATQGRSGSNERETWRAGNGEPYGDLELNANASGVRDFGAPHDYAYHPQAGHDFDPDYTSWRDEQLKAHDRDYHAWRQQQHKQYDDDYRNFRDERREHFGRTFREWRSQRNMSAGMQQQHITPESGDYAQRMEKAGGFGRGGSQPSGTPGMSGSSSNLTETNASAAAGGTTNSSPGTGGSAAQDQAAVTGTSTEFVNTSPQVQAASEGWDTRKRAEDALADHHKDGDLNKDEPRH
jgi:hypothetical protein